MKEFYINAKIKVSAKDLDEAREIAQKADKLLGQSMTKLIFKGQKIPMVDHAVDLEPEEV